MVGPCNHARAFSTFCKSGRATALRLPSRAWVHGSRSRPRRPGSSGGSRAPRDAAAARRCPGSSSGSSIPARSTRSPHAFRTASRSSRRRTARRRRPRWPSAILAPTRRLAWNNSGANLASGVTSTLLAADGAELGLLEVDEFALPEVMRRARVPASSASGTCSATSSTATGSSSTSPSAGAMPSRSLDARGDARRRTPTIRSSPSLADGRETTLLLRRRRPAARASRRSSTRPTRSTASAAAHPYRYDAAYVGHLGAYRCEACGHARPPLDVAARDDRARRARRRLLRPRDAGGRRTRPSRRSPGSTTSTTRSRAASLALSLGVAARRHRRGARARSRPRSGASSASRSATAASCSCSSRTRPARTRRSGRSRTAASRPRWSSRSTTAIADGRDVSWIWDVDFEPLLERAERDRRQRRAGGRARAAVHLRGLPARTARGRAGARGGARPGARADAGRRRARGAPDLHRDARAARDRDGARLTCGRTGRSEPSMIVRVGHLYPEYLNIYADRGNIAVLERRARPAATSSSVEPGRRSGPLLRSRIARPPLRRRRPGSRAGDDRAGPRRARRRARERPSSAAPRCSPSAAATSSSGAAIAGATASWLPGAGALPARDARPATRG